MLLKTVCAERKYKDCMTKMEKIRETKFALGSKYGNSKGRLFLGKILHSLITNCSTSLEFPSEAEDYIITRFSNIIQVGYSCTH